MYPGIACSKDIPIRKTKALHFKANEDGNVVSPALMVPAVNICENESEYLIILATSGLQREDFSITIDQSVISISAKREIVPLNRINDRCEYDYTDWTRAFVMPDDADALLAHAVYRNGEMAIHIPRNNSNKNQVKATIYVY
jgi:HSP20 family protein